MANWTNEQEARTEIKKLVIEYYHDYHENKCEYKPGDKIPYSGRVYDEAEMCSLTDALLDFWLTAGKYTEQFEREIAEFLKVKYACLVNSGSSANLLAFMTLTAPELGERMIKPGDEVITVACGFPTTITPIIQYGAIPVFIDVTIPQYNIDIEKLEEALSNKTKAIFIAHTLGNPFNLEAVVTFCKKHNLWLIEDNCDALGSLYTMNGDRRYTGAWGDISTSSFYPPHHITMGEGGCVFTSNPLLYKIMKSFRDWGRECICASGEDNFCGHRFDGQFGQLPKGYDHKYVYSHFGYNLKATDMQAAIGVAQMRKLPEFISARKANWEYLHARLLNLSDRIILPEPAKGSEPSWFGFLITIKPECKVNRTEATKILEDKGIQTRLLFSGNFIKHPCFDAIRDTDKYRVVGELANTDYIMNNSFWVGVYPGMSRAKLDYIVDQITNIFE